MPRRSKIKTRAARIIWIGSLTLFITSLATIAVFYYFFRDELIADAVRRVVERTVGYRVSLTGIHLVSPGRVSVEGMDLAIGSTVFSSGPATIQFRLGLSPALTIKKITVRNPSLSMDLSRGGKGEGDRMIRTLMNMDIAITDGDFVVIDKGGRYVFLAVDMGYERGIVVGVLTFSGSARTEVRGDGPILDGPLSGRLRITGTYPDVSARGTITTRDSGYRIDDYVFSGKRLDAQVRADRDVMEATAVSIDGLSITNRTRGIRLDGIVATGRMENETVGPFTLSDVKLGAPRFGDVSLDLVVNENGTWVVTASSDNLILSGRNLKSMGDFVPSFLAGWGAKGRVKGTLTMETVDTGDGSIAGSVNAGLVNAGFSSPDSLYLGDGIFGTVKLQFRDDVRRGFLFDAVIDARDFGLLLSDFFVNFEKRQISAKVSGRLPAEGGVRDLQCELSVPSVLSAGISGNLDFGPTDARGDLTYRLKAGDMGGAFDLFFRDFFKNRIAWLYGGAVAGSLESRGRVSGNLSAPRVSGSLSVTGASLGFPDIDTKIEGISASVPFSLDLSVGPKMKPSPRFAPGDFGGIAFSHAVVGGVDIGGMTVSPALAGNALTFKNDLIISLSGGTITVGGFTAGDIFDENRTIALSLRVENVDLAGIFPKEKSINLEGELSGDLSEVRIAGKKLFTSGLLTAKIFKGEVGIGKIWGQDVFDAGRRLGCDVTFAGIDLGALTQTIDVGRVTGIAEGQISDFVFSYGGPEQFDFDIHTVDRRGVEKRVSVDFVDKLTILGSGSTLFSGVLRGGIKQFIHDYNYSKIGIHLELKNDYFTLRGTIQEGDKEYFIKRSGLTGINVINQNPDNRIRFTDMVQRLERINVSDTEGIKVETR